MTPMQCSWDNELFPSLRAWFFRRSNRPSLDDEPVYYAEERGPASTFTQCLSLLNKLHIFSPILGQLLILSLLSHTPTETVTRMVSQESHIEKIMPIPGSHS